MMIIIIIIILHNNWVDKLIHWQILMKLKFDHTNKWYMHNPAQDNNTYKLLWDFDIHYYLISTRRPDLIIINKKN